MADGAGRWSGVLCFGGCRSHQSRCDGTSCYRWRAFRSCVRVCHREFRVPRGARRAGSRLLSAFQPGSGQPPGSRAPGGSRPRRLDPVAVYEPWVSLAQGARLALLCTCRNRTLSGSFVLLPDQLRRAVNERSGPNSCLVFIPVRSLGPRRREDGSGDKPNPGAPVVYHRLWILRQPPDQRDVLRLL